MCVYVFPAAGEQQQQVLMRRQAEPQQQEGVLAKSKASHAAFVAASEERLRARSSELDKREGAGKEERASLTTSMAQAEAGENHCCSICM